MRMLKNSFGRTEIIHDESKVKHSSTCILRTKDSVDTISTLRDKYDLDAFVDEHPDDIG